ncbi:hypothetical protein Tsubulata_001322 [Turnera subulata]|uniref:Cholesterol oxidase n=1 Tax=Turnera subulata TaxID=218843 RepID=A0A9Q0J6E2_9ROSI|nr:hypothetical protein Tsubulata_001322 [Turnera subulata]
MEKEANADEGYDAIVVGSGYGGSVAACRMSMAGIKVCLLEKGRRWNPEDFPTNSLKIVKALRVENSNLGFSFGPKDALFQLHEQEDSLAAVACGLGGGSLVNCGVMLPTPARARRNPKWPKEWESDWDSCEASAAEMLKIQSIPTKFPVARIMEEIADDDGEMEGNIDTTSMKLSVNFDIEEPPSNSSSKPRQNMGSCVACGNCIAGCPYNAKRCTVRTGCQVQYVVDNQYGTIFPQEELGSGKSKRRWRVYLNEFEYITSDFVVLSAGVFGTTEILFQSQRRGLWLSETLGRGFNCYGNNVACLAGSPAPLNSYGLGRNQVSDIPFEERPGPSISSSLTSSLGFTIQTAVLPRAYPHLLFKGIVTYGWPPGFWFLHGIIDEIKKIVGLKSCQAMVLNAMGYDKSDGKITFDKSSNKICFRPPHDPLLPRKVEAFQKLTKKLGGILFMSRYRSTSVHLLGGCNASPDSSGGVCNHKGQVFHSKNPSTVHQGLYVCDASVIPCSIGINPCLTIATAAEHISKHLVKDILNYKAQKRKDFIGVTVNSNPVADTWISLDTPCNSTLLIRETMRGSLGGIPCTAYLKMEMNSRKNHMSFENCDWITKTTHPLLKGKVSGYLVCRGIEKEELHIIDGEIDMCKVDCRTPYTQYMHYHLLLAASSGKRYILNGKKIMNPFLFGLYAWKETTTLHVAFSEVVANGSKDSRLTLRGELTVTSVELLKALIRLEGNSKTKFMGLLLQSFVRTYIFQIPRTKHKEFHPSDSCHKSYPTSTLHKILAEDGNFIRCRHWKCMRNPERNKEEKLGGPVLLLNGYAGECYWLPTEPHDLVRTLVDDGHDVWLLQSRLHPSNPASNSTIEDIGKYDIPAAISKIIEQRGPAVKIHVVAHCIGGLAIHMALMGGHVSAANISSLSCTNTSMFFKLNALSKIKMWLPLVPISLALLGKDVILPMVEESNVSTTGRQWLVKCIAQCIPRYERCSCKECEVFSGIFGNVFWHDNISPSLHYWLNKKVVTSLPLSAFPHLRKICNAGYIVDSKGNNSYLIHPERMAVSTLYISGRRTLLATTETSFLANKYMKLHQPSFRHERVVVEDFGHSDLLIGEKSCEKVFPHILAHIRSAEQDRNNGMKSSTNGVKKYRKEVLDWGNDPCGPSQTGEIVVPLVSMGVGRSGGIWICWRQHLLCVSVLVKQEQLIHALVKFNGFRLPGCEILISDGRVDGAWRGDLLLPEATMCL